MYQKKEMCFKRTNNCFNLLHVTSQIIDNMFGGGFSCFTYSINNYILKIVKYQPMTHTPHLQLRVRFKIKFRFSVSPVPDRGVGICACDRRALQQLVLKVHVKHSDLTRPVRVSVGKIFKVRLWFCLSIQRRVMGGNLSLKYFLK